VKGGIMNPVIEAIKKRRSVRSYESKKVPRDIIETIIQAGNEAPSSMNYQPWRFVVVEDKEIHQKLLRIALPNAKKIFDTTKEKDPTRYESIMKRFDESEDPIYYSAPVIVFVIGQGIYAGHSCPLASENMMLAAYSLGLGSCWVGLGSMIADNPEARKLLDLKDDEQIFGPIIMGYPKSYPEPPLKKKPEVKWL
jgi:nitroreductase